MTMAIKEGPKSPEKKILVVLPFYFVKNNHNTKSKKNRTANDGAKNTVKTDIGKMIQKNLFRDL